MIWSYPHFRLAIPKVHQIRICTTVFSTQMSTKFYPHRITFSNNCSTFWDNDYYPFVERWASIWCTVQNSWPIADIGQFLHTPLHSKHLYWLPTFFSKISVEFFRLHPTPWSPIFLLRIKQSVTTSCRKAPGRHLSEVRRIFFQQCSEQLQPCLLEMRESL